MKGVCRISVEGAPRSEQPALKSFRCHEVSKGYISTMGTLRGPFVMRLRPTLFVPTIISNRTTAT
jgi:hypothetical protein